MSKIFDALRQAELDNAERTQTRPPPRRADSNDAATRAETIDRRRTKRANVQIPLFVYGYTVKDAPFFEDACTIEINAHGALIAMRTLVQPGEKLLLTNAHNQRTQECTVVWALARSGAEVQAAVEFAAASPHFWRKSPQNPSEKQV